MARRDYILIALQHDWLSGINKNLTKKGSENLLPNHYNNPSSSNIYRFLINQSQKTGPLAVGWRPQKEGEIMIELKPCPCCGKQPQIWPMNRRWFVICSDCFISTKSYGTKKEACSDWNTKKRRGEP